MVNIQTYIHAVPCPAVPCHAHACIHTYIYTDRPTYPVLELLLDRGVVEHLATVRVLNREQKRRVTREVGICGVGPVSESFRRPPCQALTRTVRRSRSASLVLALATRVLLLARRRWSVSFVSAPATHVGAHESFRPSGRASRCPARRRCLRQGICWTRCAPARHVRRGRSCGSLASSGSSPGGA